jgi:hypothetical protein
MLSKTIISAWHGLSRQTIVQRDLRKHLLTRQVFPVIDGDISVPEEPGLGSS